MTLVQLCKLRNLATFRRITSVMRNSTIKHQIFIALSDRLHSSGYCYFSSKISRIKCFSFSSDIFFTIDLVFYHLKKLVWSVFWLTPQECKISKHDSKQKEFTEHKIEILLSRDLFIVVRCGNKTTKRRFFS